VALGPAPGVESAGAYLRVTTPDLGPLPPTGLSAVPGPAVLKDGVVTSPAHLDLTWTDRSPDETKFTLVRSRTPDFSTIDRTVVVGGNTTTYADTTVVAMRTYYYRVNAANDGAASLYSDVASITVPPANFLSGLLSSSLVPHSIYVSFDANVDLASAALTVRNVTTGQTLPAASFTLAVPFSTSTVATYFYAADGGRLPDGRYNHELPTPVIAGGLAAFDFLFATGDATGDGTVNFSDLSILAQNYNTKGAKSYTQGDFNYDRKVDFLDLAILAQRYNTSLPAPGAAQPVAASSTSFAADWAAATASVTAPVTATMDTKKVKPKPVFSVAPVVKPAPPKSKALPQRRR
jgi:hypothetical protein